MTLYRGYETATHCFGSATPGARALMSWFLGAYAGRGGTNKGIYNCRPIPGSTTLSLHAEGRACDLGVPVGASWGQPLADALVAHSGELGIQEVIYRRRIWSGAHPDDGWRTYNGSNPHTEHIHAGLSVAAARSLGIDAVAAQLGLTDWRTALVGTLPVLRRGSTGQAVRNVQALLNARHDNHAGELAVDGVFGDHTAADVVDFQALHGLAQDGVVGVHTWTTLLTG